MNETAPRRSAHPPLFYKIIRGTAVPALGFGTYQLEGQTCRDSVRSALEVGFRHVDTARMYGNEKEVGAGIRDAAIDRSEVFLTSKVWRESLEPGQIEAEVEASLNDLGTDHLDLALIHWPNPDQPLAESIDAFRSLKEAGRLRQFGVSNFPPSLFEEAVAFGDVFCNQVEYHPLLGQERLLALAREHDVLLTAYSPLAQGEAIGYPDLEEIAKKYGKSSEQVALRWLLEQDQVAAIPRSSNPDHIASNFDVFDFELDAEDRALIDALPKDQRQVDPSFAPDWEA